MGIVGVSQGLDDAQRKVLSPLSSVGTDILVTRTVAPTAAGGAPATPSTPSAPTQRQGAGGFFANPPGGGQGGRGLGGGAETLASLNDSDATALLNENSSVVTDLSKLGKPGTKFTHDFFLAGTLITFPDQALAAIRTIAGVSSATSALTLQAQHETGTVPNIVATLKTGGEKITSTVRPAPLTASEQAAVRDCVSKNGGFPTFGGGGPPSGGSSAPPRGTGQRRGGDRLGGFAAIQKCLPQRFQRYEASVITPLRTIQQVVSPPSTDTTTQSYTAGAVDPASPNAGLVTQANVTKGAWFATDGTTNATQVLISTAYATKQKLSVGSSIAINGGSYRVAGLVDPTLTGNTADIYFTLPTLQKIAGKSGRVNEILVRVDDAKSVERVAAAIKTTLPGATVVTSKDVADTVTGSLHNAQQLASRLGGALAAIVLLAAFAIAVLLTLSSVAKRVREIGTLRALGWSRRRVVNQILTETVGIGVIGGAAGIGVGYLVALAITHLSPGLTATSNGVAAGASSVSSLFGQTTTAVTRTIHLSAPISLSTVLLGLACAIAGGIVAGAIGGWRAARLSPAVALRDLG